ncbi:MAG: twin-arginine translocation pathway signal [Kangiella sp.]|nr:MAG: twin-arginine translocation pathway signal [Kangiella sp.]
MKRRDLIKNVLKISGSVVSIPVLSLLASNASAKEFFDFYFTRLSYESGDWDVDERMPANLLNSLIEYTNIRVDLNERIIALSDDEMLNSPFCYLAGHRLVEFNYEERQNFETYVRNGGFVFVDDCNHDIDGVFAKSFEEQMAKIFGKNELKKIPNDHEIYSSFFKFDGPPDTNQELNGWGDDLVHDYLKAIEINGRIAVLYSNKDLGCEWDYDFRNKRFLAVDNTRFAVNIVVYAMTA